MSTRPDESKQADSESVASVIKSMVMALVLIFFIAAGINSGLKYLDDHPNDGVTLISQ